PTPQLSCLVSRVARRRSPLDIDAVPFGFLRCVGRGLSWFRFAWRVGVLRVKLLSLAGGGRRRACRNCPKLPGTRFVPLRIWPLHRLLRGLTPHHRRTAG